MPDRVSFSGRHLDLERIATHHADVEASLRLYFSSSSPCYARRFTDCLESEVRSELSEHLEEHEIRTIFSILSALEAAFCIDYLQRSYKRKKDPLSRALRMLFEEEGPRASLDNIFDRWKKHASVSGGLMGDLKGAFKYRHWIAHGRYWKPKLGRQYDYDGVCALAEIVFASFPLEGA